MKNYNANARPPPPVRTVPPGNVAQANRAPPPPRRNEYNNNNQVVQSRKPTATSPNRDKAPQSAFVPSVDEKSWTERFNDYMVNDGPKLVFIVLWAIANIVVVSERFYYYRYKREDVFDVLGHGVTVARSVAAGIKLNCALILVTVLRNFLSWVRGTFLGSYLPVDKNIVFHRYIAWTIAFYSILHVGAHFFNYHAISNLDNVAKLEVLGLEAAPSTYALSYFTLAGSTGHLISICMILMYAAAFTYIRSPMFNVFWFSHHLFIPFFLLNCIHGAAGLLERATFWMWIIGPAIFYTIERTLRILRGNQDTVLMVAIAHPSKVLELQLQKSSFTYKPGQYLFLNCPFIASQEWHPFTISSAPQEEFVSVHIRIVGDWTGQVWNFLNPSKKLGIVQENVLTAPNGAPVFRIDGPFGAASEEVFDYKVVMLVAGGIGVTPFGSILKNIRYSIERQGECKVQKVYFYWISRDKNAFEWFYEVLAALEAENINNFLDIRIYLTGQLSVDEIRNVAYTADLESDRITGLQSGTYFGRPNWKEIFTEKAAQHAGQRVGVFFCGPAVLSKELYKMSRAFTDTKSGTVFSYHKENF